MEYGEKVELIPVFHWAKLDHKHITETRWDWDAAIISTVTVVFVCSFTFVVLCRSPWALSLAQNLWQPPAKRKTSRSPLFYSSIKWLLQLPEFPLNQTAIKVTGWLIKLQQSFQHKGFSPRSPFPAAPRLSSKTKHPVDMARNVFIASFHSETIWTAVPPWWPHHPSPVVLNLPGSPLCSSPGHPGSAHVLWSLAQRGRTVSNSYRLRFTICPWAQAQSIKLSSTHMVSNRIRTNIDPSRRFSHTIGLKAAGGKKAPSHRIPVTSGRCLTSRKFADEENRQGFAVLCC